MQIQVNTDNHIQGSAERTRQVETVIESALERFRSRITRVEVQLSDEDGKQKSGGVDKRCVMEVRLAGLQPVIVTAEGSSIDHALDGAVDKMKSTLDRTLGRLDDKKGRTSFAGDQTT